jgi:hypothetical protein
VESTINDTAAPSPETFTLTAQQYLSLASRAEDGDLLRRSEDAWEMMTGENLRIELEMLAATWEEVQKTAAQLRVKRAAERELTAAAQSWVPAPG